MYAEVLFEKFKGRMNIFVSILFFLMLVLPQSTLASCFVNNDLTCSSPNSPWPTELLMTRFTLLYSDDVQNDPNYCALFSVLIRTECQWSDNIQAVFQDSNGKISTWATGNDSTLETLALKGILPPSFQKYFKDQGLTQVTIKNSSTFLKMGSANLAGVMQFIAPTSDKDMMQFPMACNLLVTTHPDEINPDCGYDVTCETNSLAASDYSVGESIKIIKKGFNWTAGSGGMACTPAQALQSIASWIAALTEVDDSHQFVKLSPKYSSPEVMPKYAGFGSMPLLNQTDGWIQGLLLQKYGTNYAESGICLGTSATMMALALKPSSPNSILGNQFDIIPSNQFGFGVASVPDPANSSKIQKLQYSHYATYIDEMLRWAGLLSGNFPNSFKSYKNVFANFSFKDPIASASDASSVTNYLNSFYQFYLNNKPTQDYVMTNYKQWISSGWGVVIGLQSNMYTPASVHVEGRIGHANTIISYNGKVITLADPWGVVNQVTLQDVSQHEVTITKQDYDDCLSYKKKTKDNNISCLPPTIDTSRAMTADKNFYNLLVHSGASLAQAAYIGQKALNAEDYSAALIQGYMLGTPWITKKSIRFTDSTGNTLQTSNSTGQSCTALTQGQITLNGEKYSFVNPTPFVTAVNGVNSTKYDAPKPQVSGCTNFHKIEADGTPADISTDFVGTFTYKCSEGVLTVVDSSQCQPIHSACHTSQGTGINPPQVSKLGNQRFYSAQGPVGACSMTACNSGYSLDLSLNNGTCQCQFYNVYNRYLPGKTINNQCVFSADLCPSGTVLSPNSSLQNPVCLDPSTKIISGEEGILITAPGPYQDRYLTGQNKDFLLKFLKDRKGNSFDAIETFASTYGIDAAGYLIFKGCINDFYQATKNTQGFDACLLKSSIASQIAANPSSGKNPNGSCQSGFTKDYEDKFCVSTMSSCHYGDQAYGLMTFDPASSQRCRFMGCYDGAILQKSNVSHETYVTFYGITQTDDVINYSCSNKLSPSTVNKYKNPANFPNRLSLLNPSAITYNCDGTDSMIVSDPYPPANKGQIICDPNCHTITDTIDCLKNWTTKRASLGDCYIPNGKGRYDQNTKRCLADSCHPGFAPSFNKYACVDLSRQCYSPASTSYLAQVQIGFHDEPRSACLSTKDNWPDSYGSYLNGISDSKVHVPDPHWWVSQYNVDMAYKSNDTIGATYLYPTVNFIQSKPFPTNNIIVGQTIYEIGTSTPSTYFRPKALGLVQDLNEVQISLGGAYLNVCPRNTNLFKGINFKTCHEGTASYDETTLDSKSEFLATNYACGISGPKGGVTQPNGNQGNGNYTPHICIDYTHRDRTIDSHSVHFIPCEWQLDGHNLNYSTSNDSVWAKGYFDGKVCQVTSCKLGDPVYGGDGNALYLTSVQNKDIFGKLIPYSFNNVCMTAPINESKIILQSDFTLVRRADDFFTCDVKSLSGQLIKSGVPCKAMNTTSEESLSRGFTGGGWTEYDDDWENPLDPDPSVVSLAKLKLAVKDWESNATQPCSLKANPGLYCKTPKSKTEPPLPCPAGRYCTGGTAKPIVCNEGTYSLGKTSTCTACKNTPANMKFVKKWNYIGQGATTATCNYKVVACKENGKISNESKSCVKK